MDEEGTGRIKGEGNKIFPSAAADCYTDQPPRKP